jgi:cytochrome P450
MSEAVNIDLYSPEYRANPYPFYAQVREHEPIYRIPLSGDHSAWMITRFEDAEEILRDPRFIKNFRSLIPSELQSLPADENHGFYLINQHMLSSDPPDHTRLRSLVNKAFTPQMVEQWRPRIQEITDELIDAVIDKGEMELIEEFAFPLPMTVISEMLGVPAEDRKQFRQWSNVIVTGGGERPDRSQIIQAAEASGRYLAYLIHIRREKPGDDLLTRLIEAEAEGDKLSERELISMIFLLLVAGHETTVNLIGNGMYSLLLHPDQLQKLRENPSLIKTSIEELLRYNGPLFTATGRWVSEDLDFKGVSFKRGEMVMVGIASANHDEQEFLDAEELDITRQNNHHLAFGKGIHFCLGAPLARLEGQVAIATLIRRLPQLRFRTYPSSLTWHPGTLIHALDALPVAF